MKKINEIKLIGKIIAILYWFLVLSKQDSFYLPYLVIGILGIYCNVRRCTQEKVIYNNMKKGQRYFTKISALFMSGMVALANYRCFIGEMNDVICDMKQVISIIIILIGGYIIFSEVLNALFNLDNMEKQNTNNDKDKVMYIIMFLCIVGIDLVVLMGAEYPGILTTDSINEMSQILSSQYSNHHPYYYTQIIHVLIKIGLVLFDDINKAVALYSIFSIFFMAFCFMYVIKSCAMITGSRKITVVVFLWYLIMPFHIMYSFTMWKDGKRQTMRQSLKSTPPIIGDVASCIRPEDYLTMA